MRGVHYIGTGLVAGAVALGAMLAVISFQWQSDAYPQQASIAAPIPDQAAASHARTPGSPGGASQGKLLFDGRCASCHTVGGGKRSGPDLKGVVDKRPRDWLVEFIVAPDQVIARGDPIALQLLKEYGGPMPNVGVTRSEVEAILEYLSSP